jgi:hypothetical protein
MYLWFHSKRFTIRLANISSVVWHYDVNEKIEACTVFLVFGREMLLDQQDAQRLWSFIIVSDEEE